jgi:ribose 5-phosphate isomerase B
MADAEIARIVHRVVQQAFGLKESSAAETFTGSGQLKTPTESSTKETTPGSAKRMTLSEIKKTEGRATDALPGPEQTKSTTQSKPPEPSTKTIAIGADHGGFVLKSILKDELAEAGYVITDVGTHSPEAVDYPDYAHAVAKLIASGQAWRGIVIDGAGIGSCMVANKVFGVRAALAYDLSSANNSREHNDANVLTLGAGLIGTNLAKQIVQTWLATEFGGGRHGRRVDKITAIDQEHRK